MIEKQGRYQELESEWEVEIGQYSPRGGIVVGPREQSSCYITW